MLNSNLGLPSWQMLYKGSKSQFKMAAKIAHIGHLHLFYFVLQIEAMLTD